ncbi:hypothetical protein [Haloferula luteola]|nr:hypothetical protein [Haloferula luteola]
MPMFFGLQIVQGQSYHFDTTINGEQTLQVDGNLKVSQYGGGYGGDFDVVGAAVLGSGYLPIPDLPSGVEGKYFGPVTIGNARRSMFYFSKTGTYITGDFMVPVARINNHGGPIRLVVCPDGWDYMSGGAFYTLASTNYGGTDTNGAAGNQLYALDKRSFGGGDYVRFFAYVSNGFTHLFMEFDARAANSTQDIVRGVYVEVEAEGLISLTGLVSSELALPLIELNSVSKPNTGQTGNPLGPSVTKISTDETIIGGVVTLSEPQGDISMGIFGD